MEEFVSGFSRLASFQLGDDDGDLFMQKHIARVHVCVSVCESVCVLATIQKRDTIRNRIRRRPRLRKRGNFCRFLVAQDGWGSRIERKFLHTLFCYYAIIAKLFRTHSICLNCLLLCVCVCMRSVSVLFV